MSISQTKVRIQISITDEHTVRILKLYRDKVGISYANLVRLALRGKISPALLAPEVAEDRAKDTYKF